MPCFHGRCTNKLIDFIEDESTIIGMFLLVSALLVSLLWYVDLGISNPDISRVSFLRLPHVDDALSGHRRR